MLIRCTPYCYFTIILTIDAQMIKANEKYYIVKDPIHTSPQSDFDLISFMFQLLINHSLYVVIHE